MKKAMRSFFTAVILILLILLIPIPRYLKDGGTIEYKAVLYKVSNVHSINNLESEKPYREGIIVEVFGFEIYNNVEWEFYSIYQWKMRTGGIFAI